MRARRLGLRLGRGRVVWGLGLALLGVSCAWLGLGDRSLVDERFRFVPPPELEAASQDHIAREHWVGTPPDHLWVGPVQGVMLELRLRPLPPGAPAPPLRRLGAALEPNLHREHPALAWEPARVVQLGSREWLRFQGGGRVAGRPHGQMMHITTIPGWFVMLNFGGAAQGFGMLRPSVLRALESFEAQP